MSQFPRLVPSSRTFTCGEIPTTMYKSMSGAETRILLSNKAIEHRLTLTFQNVLENGVQALMDHWSDQTGRFVEFTLPWQVWEGWSNYTLAVPDSQKWRYSDRPEVDAIAPGIMTVTVSLISVS